MTVGHLLQDTATWGLVALTVELLMLFALAPPINWRRWHLPTHIPGHITLVSLHRDVPVKFDWYTLSYLSLLTVFFSVYDIDTVPVSFMVLLVQMVMDYVGLILVESLCCDFVIDLSRNSVDVIVMFFYNGPSRNSRMICSRMKLTISDSLWVQWPIHSSSKGDVPSIIYTILVDITFLVTDWQSVILL